MIHRKLRYAYASTTTKISQLLFCQLIAPDPFQAVLGKGSSIVKTILDSCHHVALYLGLLRHELA